MTTLLRLLAWLGKRRGMELSSVCAELRREWYSRELIAKIAALTWPSCARTEGEARRRLAYNR